MSAPKAPDIKGPASTTKKVLVYILGSAVFLGAVTAGLVSLKNNSSPEEKRSLVTQTGVDPDFFNIAQAESSGPVPEILTVAELEANKKARLRANVKRKPPTRTAAKPKVKPTASDMFLDTKRSAPAVATDLNLSRLNYERRSAVMIRVASGDDDFSEDGGFITAQKAAEEEEKEQADWQEQKDWASYPVRLERTITVDRFLPAILINAINSELGGKVVAQIEENVFAAHGRKVLIPAGSKAIGRYKPLTKTGQERLTITWSRIITPDGINIHVPGSEMTDAMGRSGITGDIDKRYFERYGMALLVSILTSATSYAIPVQNQNEALVVQNFGNQQAQMAKAVLDDHLEIRPRVNIPAGSRILISPVRDIWFKPPSNNIVYAVPLDMKEDGS